MPDSGVTPSRTYPDSAVFDVTSKVAKLPGVPMSLK
jgi:hypothetical protein